MKIGLGVVSITAIVVVGLLVWFSYALDINDTTTHIDDSQRKVTGIPGIVGKYTPKPMPISHITITPRISTSVPNPTKYSPSPTKKSSSPTPTLFIQATPTPASQTTQVKVSCIPVTLICPQNVMDNVNSIIADCDKEAENNEQEYSSCKDPIQALLDECESKCDPSNLTAYASCDEDCHSKYGPQLLECKNTYDTNNETREDKYSSKFSNYCFL